MPVAPIDFATDLLDRADALATQAGHPVSTTWSVESDILRSAWVYIGASIDTYFHERVRRALIPSTRSSAAAKYQVPLGRVEEMIDRFLADRSNSRPRVSLQNIVHDALLKDTFQGSKNVERAFNLVGAQRPWSRLASLMNVSNAAVQRRLDQQYARRNRIAHEGDYSRQERPQQIWYETITRTEVNQESKWTRTFLAAADQVT